VSRAREREASHETEESRFLSLLVFIFAYGGLRLNCYLRCFAGCGSFADCPGLKRWVSFLLTWVLIYFQTLTKKIWFEFGYKKN
jgi:hypothetical protein